MADTRGRSAPIAEKLADLIGQQIADGVYRPGDKLPSLRELAQLHRYAKNTVVSAFDLLVSRGIVEPRRGSGFYVLGTGRGAQRTDEDAGQLGRAMDIVWLMREQLKTQPDCVGVGDGFPPVEWLADMRLDRYHQKVVRTGLGSLFRYGSRYGYAPLRDSLVRKLGDFGLQATPGQLVLTHGANEAMDLVIRYFVPPGATVLVDEPGYYPLFGKLRLAGAHVVGVPRLADGPDVAALESLLAQHRPRLFFTQSLAHNPTGSDISAAKAYKVLQLAERHNLLIVEDDPLADFKPTSAVRLSTLDQLERTIYIGSFSKSFSAALRVGFIACNDALASDLADLKALIHVSGSEYCERMVDVMLREGHYERHLVRLRHKLGQATAQALGWLDAHGCEVFARSPQSLYLWVAFPGVLDSLRLAEQLVPRKLSMAPGRVFHVDPSAVSRWSRCNVSAMLDPRFQAAMGQVLAQPA
ncbi:MULTISPECIES: aminotransferase-like domain-containing protein [unclassified Delftia]|uniref:aminotransferase-like domain-containing protein n=1 Tax=unclassified Delftia TaxID=2613839 RepID=UPI00044B2E8C|nr:MULTISPECIES: PLP-dependent aminotransferase family protein [unclassified Delftia]EZP51952.1 Transcriptional regulator [Delftia sp. RIT313]MBK0114847.1 PLP-dependent aminotransferase family protein [Delftia sp. S65]MBK0120778.1 PLP-dependent aminotransferase family protein [Delftia sp. S67]MBK0132450.1 PLP-dependent aminotransferase family protein [Delftia sp. S66]